MAQQIPQGDIDSRKRMVRLQQIETVSANEVSDSTNIVDVIDFLADDGSNHWLAGTV